MVLPIYRSHEVSDCALIPSICTLTGPSTVCCMSFVRFDSLHHASISSVDSVLGLADAGDIADDKYFRKANDSDATQFSLLYPWIGAHGGCSFFLSSRQ